MLKPSHLVALTVIPLASLASAQGQLPQAGRQPGQIYAQFCANCHGANHQGGNASSLADGVWAYGKNDSYIQRNIKFGITTMGMPAYAEALSDDEIKGLVGYFKQLEKEERVAPPPQPEVMKTKLHAYRVETVAEGLKEPWAIDWLPDGRGLITEKVGQVRVLENGKLKDVPVTGTPQVLVHGQGGLLDVAVDPNYSSDGNGWIYLAYTHELPGEGKGRRAMTRLVRGRLADNAWTDEQVLFEAKPEHYVGAGVHFGCRIVFDDAGHLFFSIGERGSKEHAQDVTRPNGKVHRIHLDGTIPSDNPFASRDDAYKSIFSFGNRNPQGLAIDPRSGKLWATEHGPMGGDELNLIEAGNNYGWPVITYGINYNGTPITDKTEAPGMEQPVLQWTPSIAVCGLDFYKGDAFSQWKNDLLVGALKFEEVRRVRLENDKVVEDEVIFKGRGRVRDVNSGPDGYIYVALNGPDKIVRIVPEE